MSQDIPSAARSHTPKGKLARDRILRASEPLFADRGFHGTSMRDIAVAAELPLATVVYHFAKKEKLYVALLGEIAAHLIGQMNDARAATTGPSLEAAVRGLVRWALENPGRVQLLLRDLLDNRTRVSKATATLPLQSVLTTLAAESDVPNPETAVLNVVGAVSYVICAMPTMRRMVGARRERELMRDYEEDVMALARRTLGIGKVKGAKP